MEIIHKTAQNEAASRQNEAWRDENEAVRFRSCSTNNTQNCRSCYSIMVTIARVVAEHGLFNGIRQVAPIRIHLIIVPWAHACLPPRRHLDWYGRFAGLTVVTRHRRTAYGPHSMHLKHG